MNGGRVSLRGAYLSSMAKTAVEPLKARLKKRENLQHGTVRVVGRLMWLAVHETTRADLAVSVRIHGVRKLLKRARALLRLAGPLLEDGGRQELAWLGGLARRLSMARDFDVVLATHQRLARFSDYREDISLKLEALRMSTPAADPVALLETVSRELNGHLGDWALPWADREPSLPDLLGNSEARYQLAYKRAVDSGGPRRLHDLRKRSKDLYYQLSFLRHHTARTPRLSAEAKGIGTRLGKVRDLYLYRNALREVELTQQARAGLERLARERRKKAARKAMRKAKKFHRLLEKNPP